MYDPAEHRLLEVSGTITSGHHEHGEAGQVVLTTRDIYLEQGPADVLPQEPRLDESGCVDWETC